MIEPVQKETTAPAASTGLTLPFPVVSGVVIAVVIGVAYVFFGPDAARAVCQAVL